MTKTAFWFGEWKSFSGGLNPDLAREVCQRAFNLQAEIRSIPQDIMYRDLTVLQKAWSDPTFKFRVEAKKALTEITGFSEPMIEMALQELAWTLDPVALKGKFQSEMNGIPLAPQWKFNARNHTILSAFPLGTVFHVLSGNVFLVGVGSWLEGLMTRNVNILKMSSSETYFMPHFVRSLEAVLPQSPLLKTLALVEYSYKDTEIVETFKQSCDAVVIWGGEDAVKTYRNDLPARTRSIVFGPKISFALITAEGVRQTGLENAAQKLAKEISIWDQNACTAPQVCFIEGSENAKQFVRCLAKAMADEAKRLPTGAAPSDTAAEIRKIRGVREIAQARNLGEIFDSGLSSVDWTVYEDRELSMELSPLHRTLRVTPFEKLSDVLDEVKLMRGYLQTIGLLASPFEFQKIYQDFSAAGAQRILGLGQMFAGELDDPHDGAFDIPQLMNVSVSRFQLPKGGGYDPWDFSPYRQSIMDAQLRQIVESARTAPYYQEAFGATIISGQSDFHRLPLMSREEWHSNMLPTSQNLKVDGMSGGYVTQSGGSTGKPKYSYFSKSEWDEMVHYASRVFRAMGFDHSDRVASFMSNGDLYGGFISFNAVFFGLGCQCYSMGPQPSAEIIERAFDVFGINVVVGFPPTLVKILRHLKEKKPDLKVEKILFSGSPMSQADREWLQSALGTTVIMSVIGTTEANHVAYQCSHMSGTTLHHVPDDYNYIEIIDDNGQPCKAGQYGRLVVTNMHKTSYPVIRYLNGDKAAFTDNVCGCGRLDRVIDYQGRWDDILCLANLNLDYKDIWAIAERHGVSCLQLVADFNGGKERLQILCESSLWEDPVVARNFLKAIESDLRDFKGHESLLETKVTFVKPGALERNGRTGKVKTIVDRR
jgi:phenylacetate-CoA ligase